MVTVGRCCSWGTKTRCGPIFFFFFFSSRHRCRVAQRCRGTRRTMGAPSVRERSGPRRIASCCVDRHSHSETRPPSRFSPVHVFFRRVSFRSTRTPRHQPCRTVVGNIWSISLACVIFWLSRLQGLLLWVDIVPLPTCGSAIFPRPAAFFRTPGIPAVRL